MNSDVIKSKIQDKLSEIQDLEDSIIVLKGISLDTIDMENAKKINLEAVVKNKLKYFCKNNLPLPSLQAFLQYTYPI